MSYVTNTEVAQALGWDSSDTALMADIDVALAFVEPAVDQYCGTTFQQEDGVTRIYNGTGHPMLSLGFYLRNLTSVYVLVPVIATLPTYQMTPVNPPLPDVMPMPQPSRDGTYRWLERMAMDVFDIHYEPNVFPKGLGNIQVTGDWGFTVIPKSVKQAIFHAVKYYFDLRDMDATVRTVIGVGHTKENPKPDDQHYLPPISRRLLDRYKNDTWMAE